MRSGKILFVCIYVEGLLGKRARWIICVGYRKVRGFGNIYQCRVVEAAAEKALRGEAVSRGERKGMKRDRVSGNEG